MKIIPNISLLVLILFGICSGVKVWKPTIFPERKELVIQEGDKLELKCRGKGELQFSRQKLRENTDTDLTIQFINTYTFVRFPVERNHSGWYACAKKGITIKNTEQTVDHPSNEDISWIYVYVNSSKPFVDMDASYMDAYITAVTTTTAVIPCRPTSPELRVTLSVEFSVWKYARPSCTEGFEDAPEAQNITYDPRIGFIMKNIDGSKDGTKYECGIDSCGGDDYALYPSYALEVKTIDPLPAEQLKIDPLIHAVPGQNVILHCNMTVYKGTDVHLMWQAPNSVSESRLKPEASQMGTEYVTHMLNLTIKDTRDSDAGVYICLASGLVDSVNKSTTLRIMDPDKPYINVTVKGDQKNSIVAFPNEKYATWIIDIDAFPIPIVEWYKGNELIKNVGSDKRHQTKYIHYTQLEQNVFKISNLNIRDTGNYTIHLNNTKRSKNVTLELMVHVQPVVRIHSDKPYYRPGELAVYSCNTTGLPTPNATWSFSERISDQNHTTRLPVNIQTEAVNSDFFSVQYDLKMPVTAMGNLTCRSCNERNCTEATEPVFVSDGNGFFGIDCDRPPVVEGDDITLKCAASVYNYTNNITWKYKDSEELVLIPRKMTVRNVSTDFTFQSVLQILNVSKKDAGRYSCEAETKAGVINTSNYTLIVNDSSPPFVKAINLNESETHVDLVKEKRPIIRNITCEVKGNPPPKVTWWKDGKSIKKYPQLEHRLLKNDTMLQIRPSTVEDGGNYSCIAKNRLGSVERWVNIVIKGKSDSTGLWISLVCILIIIIIIVISYMGVKVHRERILRKELCDAGLTHFENGALECLNPDLTIDDQAELLPYDKKWEFPRELLKLGKQLGSGAFGVVMKAEARGICVEGETTTVAVKMVRRSADPSYMKALSSELKIMIHLGRHLNVVNLLGACTKTILTKRELYVIVEYCRFGNLHNYLQRHRSSFIDQIDPATQKIDLSIGLERLLRSGSVCSQNRVQSSFSRSLSVTSSDSNTGTELVDYRQCPDFGDVNMSPDGGVLSNNSVQPGWRSNYRGDYREQNSRTICTHDLLCWAWQVASGMKYLSERKVLHGDLAARNILLADDDIVKICDFGLAKNMYKDNNYKKKGEGPLPIKWMAVESIRDRIFSTQSDVWSFGIVLWEFFTLARTPYPGMEAEKQYDRLIEGYRMEKPEYATDEIYDFMLRCWKAKPSLRPLFPELTEQLGFLLNDGVRMHYLDLNTPYMDMNTINLQNGQNDYLTMMSSPDHDYHNSPEIPSDTNYLPMSPVVQTNDSCIFSPRTGVCEVQFEFPPPNRNIPSDDTAEGEGLLKDSTLPEAKGDDPEKNPVDVEKERVALIDLGQESNDVERESGYCTDTSNRQFNRWNSQFSDDSAKGSYKNLGEMNNTRKESNKVDFITSPVIHAENNYINMPKKKISGITDTADSFSNPSYVMMSKLEEAR